MIDDPRLVCPVDRNHADFTVHLGVQFPAGFEDPEGYGQILLLQRLEGTAEALPVGERRVGDDQDHGKLPPQDRAAGVGNIASQVEKNLGDLGNDAGAVAADDGQGKIVHGVLRS